jgi:hypothetical protein
LHCTKIEKVSQDEKKKNEKFFPLDLLQLIWYNLSGTREQGDNSLRSVGRRK